MAAKKNRMLGIGFVPGCRGMIFLEKLRVTNTGTLEYSRSPFTLGNRQ
jgi:hypothetical protein